MILCPCTHVWDLQMHVTPSLPAKLSTTTAQTPISTCEGLIDLGQSAQSGFGPSFSVHVKLLWRLGPRLHLGSGPCQLPGRNGDRHIRCVASVCMRYCQWYRATISMHETGQGHGGRTKTPFIYVP